MADVLSPQEAERLKYFTYDPANVYPQVSTALFFVVGCILVWQIVRWRAAAWLGILPGTAFAECLGYVFRTVCLYQMSFGMYVAMMLFLLVPVNALALANYKAVGKIISQSGVRSRWWFLRPAFVNWFYFSSDIFSIAMQGAGGGMLTGDKTRDAGRAVVMVGLVVQLFFFACFIATAIFVWRRPEYRVHVSAKDKSQQAAKKHVMVAVLATTVLIYLRSIYRIAEFADGYGGKIYSAEWAFYVFDTIIIFLAFVVYSAVFIGRNFPRDQSSVDLSSGSTTVTETPSDSSHNLIKPEGP